MAGIDKSGNELHSEAEAPSGARREGGAMRRPEGAGRNEVETVFPLKGGCREATGGWSA